MLNEQTITTLNSLKLFGMAMGFEKRLNRTKPVKLSHAEFVGLLVQDEKTYRDNQRLKRLLRTASLRQQAALEDMLGKVEKWTAIKFKGGLRGTPLTGRQQSARSGYTTISGPLKPSPFFVRDEMNLNLFSQRHMWR